LEPTGAPGAREKDRADFRLSGEWRVTQFGEFTACPFRFYAGSVLGLSPLRLASEGIDPLERGSALHRVLAAFVDGLRLHVPGWPQSGRGVDQGVRVEALAWLNQVVDAELTHRPRNVFWEVERLRWMGDDEIGAPGLLTVWLGLELERAETGWTFEAAEAEFDGLALGPVTLKGRVDRVDRHPDHGVAVWDYKSGRPPSAAQVVERFEEPQLPAYLLALTRGLVRGVEPAPAGIRAGYIALRRPGEAAVMPLQVRRQEVDWAEFLPRWIEAAQARMADSVHGLFSADPRPASRGAFTKRNGACQYCEFYDLCGRFEGAPADGTEEEDAEEETV
jgi:RecB family exonuclease